MLKRLANDLSERFGRGFSERNLEQMRAFYLGWPIPQASSAKSLPSPDPDRTNDISKAAPAKSLDAPRNIQPRFPLPWTHPALFAPRMNS